MTQNNQALQKQQWHAMLESQLRACGVQNHTLYTVMRIVPRHQFIPEAARALAYADIHVPLPPLGKTTPSPASSTEQRHLLSPSALAQMIDLLAPQVFEKGLDIACNCGYSTAVLSLLCDSTIGIETDANLAAYASEQLETAQMQTAAVVAKAPHDLWSGYDKSVPYDFLFINGSLPALDTLNLSQLWGQLRDGGRLVCGQKLKGHHRLACYQHVPQNVDMPMRLLATAPRDVALPEFPPAILAPIMKKQTFAKRYGFA